MLPFFNHEKRKVVECCEMLAHFCPNAWRHVKEDSIFMHVECLKKRGTKENI
jgi:hypothetical protein